MIPIPATRRWFPSRLSQVTSATGLLGLAPSTSGQSGELASGRDVFDVTAFGARGDGKALDTAAINQAIPAGAAAGGGFIRTQVRVADGFSLFALRDVGLFRLRACAHLPDMNLDQVAQKEILQE